MQIPRKFKLARQTAWSTFYVGTAWGMQVYYSVRFHKLTYSVDDGTQTIFGEVEMLCNVGPFRKWRVQHHWPLKLRGNSTSDHISKLQAELLNKKDLYFSEADLKKMFGRSEGELDHIFEVFRRFAIGKPELVKVAA